MVPGSPFANSGEYNIFREGVINFPQDNLLNTLVTVQKTSLGDSGQVTLLFRGTASGLSVWVIVLIVLSAGFGLVALSCIVYHMCRKAQHGQ